MKHSQKFLARKSKFQKIRQNSPSSRLLFTHFLKRSAGNRPDGDGPYHRQLFFVKKIFFRDYGKGRVSGVLVRIRESFEKLRADLWDTAGRSDPADPAQT